MLSDREENKKVCEIYSWCPVEIDELPMPGNNLRCVHITYLVPHLWREKLNKCRGACLSKYGRLLLNEVGGVCFEL